MLRMWVKFKEEDGRKVIDRATFQTFGCQTAIAVASVATEMLAGKTVDEAISMSGEDLAAPLGRAAAGEDSLRAARRRRAARGLSGGERSFGEDRPLRPGTTRRPCSDSFHAD